MRIIRDEVSCLKECLKGELINLLNQECNKWRLLDRKNSFSDIYLRRKHCSWIALKPLSIAILDKKKLFCHSSKPVCGLRKEGFILRGDQNSRFLIQAAWIRANANNIISHWTQIVFFLTVCLSVSHPKYLFANQFQVTTGQKIKFTHKSQDAFQRNFYDFQESSRRKGIAGYCFPSFDVPETLIAFTVQKKYFPVPHQLNMRWTSCCYHLPTFMLISRVKCQIKTCISSHHYFPQSESNADWNSSVPVGILNWNLQL